MNILSRVRSILPRVFLPGMVQDFFNEVYIEAARTFYEDNQPTLDAFLAEVLKKASANYWGPLLKEQLESKGIQNDLLTHRLRTGSHQWRTPRHPGQPLLPAVPPETAAGPVMNILSRVWRALVGPPSPAMPDLPGYVAVVWSNAVKARVDAGLKPWPHLPDNDYFNSVIGTCNKCGIKIYGGQAISEGWTKSDLPYTLCGDHFDISV